MSISSKSSSLAAPLQHTIQKPSQPDRHHQASSLTSKLVMQAIMIFIGVCAFITLVSVAIASSPPMWGPPPGFLEPPPDPGRLGDVDIDPTKVVESFRVRSDIRYRFATTQMSSVVRNVASKAQEIGFDVTLPKNAFIMDFFMTIDGKRYDGEVKERREAKRQYQEAVNRGQSAGHVRQAARHANLFEVSVNVANGSAVNFTLTYQEVLRRRLGVYEHEIHVSPGQPVEDFRIEVYIQENRPLKFVRTPALRTDYLLTNQLGEAGKKNEMTIVDRPSAETAAIVYEPSLSEQGDGEGISARFAVQYDVEHAGPKGDVLVVDGYFVHFIVPDGLPQTLPKDIIFVLDVSGSMYGTKIQQLQVAMRTILSDLQSKDRFNIITFSSGPSKWKEGLVPANEQNVGSAQSFVSSMPAHGMTNINDALLTALSEMKSRQDKERVGMIFFLTDGHPTEGETSADKIASNVLNANEGPVAIYSLAFGDGADYDSLKSLSAQNLGFARKIYEASDAALQVSSLYDEISAVSVKDMSIKYQKNSVDEFSLTETEFPIVFNGTEIMICGFLHNYSDILRYEITGLESQGKLDITAEVNSTDTMLIDPEKQNDQLFTGPRDFSGMVERMWAYQTIRQLLRQKEKYAGEEYKVKQLDKKILELSLKYKFVTPLTSMVVTKPDEGETEVRETDPTKDDKPYKFSGGINGPRGPLRKPKMTKSNGRQHHGKMHISNNRVRFANDPSNMFPSMQFDPHPRQIPSMQFYPDPFHTVAALTTGFMFKPATTTQPDPLTTTSTARSTSATSTSTTTTTATTTPMTTTKSTQTTTLSIATSKSTSAAPRSTSSSFLRLVTLRLDLNSQPPPVICMVPRMWKYGNIILVSEINGSRVVLTQCSKRQCPKAPSIKSLRFESGRTATEVQLDGQRVWQYTNNFAYNVSIMSNQKMLVHGHGLSATVEKIKQGGSVGYNVELILHIKGHPTSGYSGLLGELWSKPGQLQRLSKNRAKKVCKNKRSQHDIVVYNKLARQYSVYRTRQNLLKQKLFS